MSCHPRVTEWTTIIRTHLPHLTKPQATVLALWSLGMVLARSCALTAVSVFLATWLHRKEDAVRQQLREFCSEATAKRGTARQELVVETCFVPLLAWVVDQWEGTQLALVMTAPLASTTARSMTFSSSRTFPGQLYFIRCSMASCCMATMSLWFSRAYFCKKCAANSGTSWRRSRRGGKWMVMTLSR